MCVIYKKKGAQFEVNLQVLLSVQVVLTDCEFAVREDLLSHS